MSKENLENKSHEQTLESELSEAIAKNDLEKVKRLLRDKPDPIEAGNKSPLYIAVEENNIELTRLILQMGANPNFDVLYNDSEDGLSIVTPLTIAIKNGNIDIVKLLLQYGADPFQIDPLSKKTPIDYIKDEKIRNIFVSLLKNKIMSEEECKEKLPSKLIIPAIVLDVYKEDHYRDLVKRGIEDNQEIPNIGTPVDIASERGDSRLEDILAELGAKKNHEGEEEEEEEEYYYNQQEQILEAVQNRNYRKVKTLANNGVDLNEEKVKANIINKQLLTIALTPLNIAVKKKDTKMIKLLLEKGADPFYRDFKGYSPYDYALQSSNQEIINIFQQKVFSIISEAIEQKKVLPLPVAVAATRLLKTNNKDIKDKITESLLEAEKREKQNEFERALDEGYVYLSKKMEKMLNIHKLEQTISELTVFAFNPTNPQKNCKKTNSPSVKPNKEGKNSNLEQATNELEKLFGRECKNRIEQSTPELTVHAW